MKKRFVLVCLCIALLLTNIPVAMADVKTFTSEEAMLTMNLANVDQRSAKAKQVVDIEAGTVQAAKQRAGTAEAAFEEIEVATFLLDAKQARTSGTTENYVTVARATTPATAVEEAGDLTIVAMIYWELEYTDFAYDISFDYSSHLYHDGGSSGVYRMYGENYVNIGAPYDIKSMNWNNPVAGMEHSMANGLSGVTIGAYGGAFLSTAITTVYAQSPVPSLTVSVNKNS